MARRWWQFRLWVVTVIVAVAALALGAERLRREAIAYRRLADLHQGRAKVIKASVVRLEHFWKKGYVSAAVVRAERAELEREQRRAEMYSRAARRPWLPVAPGPE